MAKGCQIGRIAGPRATVATRIARVRREWHNSEKSGQLARGRSRRDIKEAAATGVDNDLFAVIDPVELQGISLF
jgi:hypothetical protein